MVLSPANTNDEIAMVQIMPDWNDPSGRRWLLSNGSEGRTVVTPCADEQDARLRAFMATGVGDFLAGVTWVRIPRLAGVA
ncbi:hypothetical protein [Alsobacter sp. R-9]